MKYTVKKIAVEKIKAGNNDRTVFNQNALAALAASIDRDGLAQPITVRHIGGGQYEIVAGERRFRACSQILGWAEMPCIVRRMNAEQASAVMLAENTGRQDLNPIDEGLAYQKRVDQFGWTITEIAKAAGVSKSRVSDRIRLLGVDEEFRPLVASGQLPIGHAMHLVKLDVNFQRLAIRVYSRSESMNRQKFAAMCNELLGDQNQQVLFTTLEHYWLAQVAEPKPTRGKRAKTGAPTRDDLPPVKTESTDSTAKVMHRYIADLLTAGHKGEAAALGNVYQALVAANFMSVATDLPLLEEIE